MLRPCRSTLWRGDRIELGADDPDHARLLQPADPVQCGRRGQPDQPGQLDVGPVGILLQRSEQLYVNFVKLNRHKTKYYLVTALN